jgi:hypothetical protein
VNQKQIVVRLILRRVTEEIDQNEFLELNFTDDYGNIESELSVYLVPEDGSRMLQIKAEHTAFSGASPAVKGALDVTELFSVSMKSLPDGGCFDYRNKKHNVLMFDENPSDAKNLVLLYYASPSGRLWISERSQINEYGKREYEKGNKEWRESAENCRAVMRWVKKKPNLSVKMIVKKI